MKRTILVLGILVSLTACGKLNETLERTKSMPDKMDRMYAETTKLPCELKSGISFEALLKEEMGRHLIPVPFDLMPFAKKFAQCASNQDLTEVIDLWLNKFNEVALEVENPTPEQIAKFDHEKLHMLSALEAVAGFIPDDKVKQIVETQIRSDGPYRPAMMSMLMMRVRFLRDVLLNAKLFSKGMSTVGHLQLAVSYAESIEYVSRLAFVEEISVEILGFMDPKKNKSETMDPQLAQKIWVKVREHAVRGIQVVPKDLTGTPAEDERLFRERQALLQQNLNLVDQRISDWENQAQ